MRLIDNFVESLIDSYIVRKQNAKRKNVNMANGKRKAIKCLRCGWLWVSSQERPLVCPKCKNRNWDYKGGIV